MVRGIERIVVGVSDLTAAVAKYRMLFAAQPLSLETDCARLALANTVLELRAHSSAGITAVVFGSDQGFKVIENSLGLDLFHSKAAISQRAPTLAEGGWGVDHLVLRTTNAQACIDLFSEELGIRLALDKNLPQWGGRMLFFRTGKVTLEVIESEQEPVDKDSFWGLAYQCENLAGELLRLADLGVDCSPLRQGRKPGTQVATLKSHNLGIPTLLIQPAPSK